MIQSIARMSLRFHGMLPINLLHDPLGPSDRVGNGAHRGRHPCSAVVLRQFPCHEDIELHRFNEALP